MRAFIVRASKWIAALVLASFIFPAAMALAAPRGGRRGGPPPVRRESRPGRPERRGPSHEFGMRRDVRRPVHGPDFSSRPPRGHGGYHGFHRDYGRRPPRRHRSYDTGKGIAIGIGIFALLTALSNMNSGD